MREAAPENGLCVLASGSTGNCSVLRVTIGGTAHHCLIDLGLSPRRTRKHLEALGLTLADIEAVLITHFDSDHCHAGWCTAAALPRETEVFLHRSHLRRSQRVGLRAGRVAPFREAFHTPAGLPVQAALSSHDQLGAAVFRIGTPGGTLGFATDLGRASPALVAHLSGVDVLAIESNYCPRLEVTSGRPEQLIRRVMGGFGHLSNEEAIEAIRRIGPRGHVILLHLSQQCNRPELVHALHEGLGYAFTVSLPDQATGWIALRGEGTTGVTLRPRAREMSLFE